MNKLKSIFFVVLFFVISINISIAEDDLPNYTEDFYVNDFANVISDEDESKILEEAKELYKDTGSTQVVVAAVESLNGYTIQNYANALYRKWGIGANDKNCGVLILVSVKDRKLRIEVGYDLEDVITDDIKNKIISNYMTKYLKEDDYSKGIVSGFEKTVDIINGGTIENVEDNTSVEVEKSEGKISIGIIALISIIFIMCVTAVAFIVSKKTTVTNSDDNKEGDQND